MTSRNSWPDSELLARLRAATPWHPLPGPQSQAYLSLADELYYGGAAGGGKTQLLIGLALTAHRDALILRRRAVDSRAIAKVLASMGYGQWRWRGAGGELLTPDGRTIEVGGCEHETDAAKYQGQPHDLIAFDELPQFLESQYQFISGWNRVLRPEQYPRQRCRVVGAGNPPTTPEGEWVLRRWRAWLDPTGEPARPGELRWYTTIAGEEVECPDGSPIIHAGQSYTPRSRTFIPARLEDNPALMRTGYAATLEAMPEPLRSMLRYGDMHAARQDDAWQLIPSRWLTAAAQRWHARSEAGFGPIAAIGVDPARGGDDQTAIATLHGMTIGQVIRRPGVQTPDGQSVLALVLAASPEPVPVHVDAIGIGAAICDLAKAMGWTQVMPIIASEQATWRDPRVPHLRFTNQRAAMYWRLRALLDPDGGPDETRLAIPPDGELARDLLAIRYTLQAAGIRVENKDEIRKRLGRSPDAGDAVALACWSPPQILVA